MDFTVATYKRLLLALHEKRYALVPFREYLEHPCHQTASQVRQHAGNFVTVGLDSDRSDVETIDKVNLPRAILRHDVDRLPRNSLRLARLEHELGITGSYYFRVVPESYDLEVMERIAHLGHEIGYHYEDVDLIIQSSKLKIHNSSQSNLIDLAYESFSKNLEMLRKDFDVTTACMHGSPRSKYDNRMIWKEYNYRDLGIVGEPYFDIDFNEVAYFTDTGRRWNGDKVSVRDKVDSKYNFNFRTTTDLIDGIDALPNQVMLTVHPQRWTDSFFPWARELVWQNVKNVGKRSLLTGNVRL